LEVLGGDEVAMMNRALIMCAVATGLFGFMGYQQLSITGLEGERNTLNASVAKLELSNTQHIEDLNAANLTIIDSQAKLLRERSITSSRELQQKEVRATLLLQISSLREKAIETKEQSSCMRSRMPEYAISVLSQTDADSNNTGSGGENNPAVLVK